jgi:hypothetical protein
MTGSAAARIGYSGYSDDWQAPGDRRRFVAYAAMRGLPIVHADPAGDFDVVYLTHHSDLPAWIRRKRAQGDSLKIIFELIDSYLVQDAVVRRFAKGTMRWLGRRDSRPTFDYLETLRTMCRIADVVICSTLEQQRMIGCYNPVSFISFDYFANELPAPKTEYQRSGKLKLVWEGQAATLANLNALAPVLNDFADDITLSVVTDEVSYRYMNRYGRVAVEVRLSGLTIPYEVKPWGRASFAQDVQDADLAIIPIDQTDSFASGKPDNKLVMFWQLGMPVLTGDTPAYRRAMTASGFEQVCETADDWRRVLRQWSKAPSETLRTAGTKAHAFSSDQYSAARFCVPFDAALAHVHISPRK